MKVEFNSIAYFITNKEFFVSQEVGDSLKPLEERGHEIRPNFFLQVVI